MVSLFDYTDYRHYLKDKFADLKKSNHRFSYRFFNRLAGVKSSGFLKLVMDGKRNLAVDGIRMIVKGFKMNESEASYFEGLVKFNQATTHEEKDHFFQKLSQNKKFLRAKPLIAAQYRLFSHWYYVAILEIVRLEAKKIDAKWIHQRINPPVGLVELKHALRDLIEMDLLEIDKNKNIHRKDSMISTSDEVQSLAVSNFHVQMSELARRAVMQEWEHEREFSALTIAMSEESLRRAKKEIQEFRKKLHSILEQEGNSPKNMVGQINLQLFKLTKPERVL